MKQTAPVMKEDVHFKTLLSGYGYLSASPPRPGGMTPLPLCLLAHASLTKWTCNNAEQLIFTGDVFITEPDFAPVSYEPSYVTGISI